MNNLKKTWDNVFQNRTWGEFPAEDLVRFFSKFNHFKNPHVLEIGCGPGYAVACAPRQSKFR